MTLSTLKMWPFILFLGIACRVKSDEIHGMYRLDINNGNLKNVKLIGGMTDNNDLSSLGIKKLERDALDNLNDAKSLNLANNSLEYLPEFIFSNMTKLENLSLANNKLSSFENAFVGLHNLKMLNISNNSFRHLRKSYFFGLSKFTDIITEGNEFWSISTALFENPFLRDPEIILDEESKDENENTSVSIEDTKNPTLRNDYDNDDDVMLDESLQAKICKNNDGLVKSVGELKKNEVLEDGCSQASINYQQRTLILRNLGIKKFEKQWYQLDAFPFNSIDLTNNKISDITPELLNDLPATVAYVNLGNNEVMIIRKHVIENYNLNVLNFKDNKISEIEYGALEKTNLSGLSLIGNNLESLNFVPSLPASLHELIISKNKITEIPDNIFAKLKKLVYLNLDNNNIEKIDVKSLHGLSSLQVLIMTKNKLANIKPGSFNDLMSLRTLYLYHNSINSLENGVWGGLENLKDLNLAWNKLTIITNDTFFGLPETLRDLHVDYNEIERLDVGSFNRVPKITLSLDGNKIENILKGTFCLPNLQELYLKNNSLESIDGDSFDGVPRLRRLSLNSNRINTINKGAAKYLGRIHILDISNNPIDSLKNGALFGLPKTKGSFVYVSDTHLNVIQGGVFEDV